MKRTKNQGVSLIEILIAVVIFTICITPIISQLIVGLRISKKADDQQAATDYAKSIAETVKQMELQDYYSLDELDAMKDEFDMDSLTGTGTFYSIKADGSQGTVIPAGSKLAVAGGSYTSVTSMYQAINQANVTAAQKEALVRQYQFIGTAEVDDREYDVQIDMSTKPYAIDSLTDSDEYDLNAVNLGNLSSLDATTTAIIADASNYDAPVSVSFFNSVISTLESSGDSADASKAVQLKNGSTVLGDTATKTMEITIDNVPSDPNGYKYKVTCTLTYKNSYISTHYGVPADECTIVYEVHNQMYKEFPDVYLMYNQFMYNKSFGDDVIKIENNTNMTAKVYVIRTAETSSGVQDVTNVTSSGNLIPTVVENKRDVMDGSNFMYTTRFEIINDPGTYPVNIYTNIPLERTTSTGATVSNIVSSGTGTNRTAKMSINVSEPTEFVKSLEEDERYSEQGRIYDIVITLTNTETGIVTTFDTSKGDY